jgi:branched-chain amino acid transport system ATP-binding protein
VSAPLLEVSDLNAWYGQAQALHGVSLQVGEGECVALIGRNGAGKTTTLRSIMGVLRKKTGSIRLRGEDVTRLSSHEIARKGISYVPEERAIFATLTVRENLELPPVWDPKGWTSRKCYEAFPALEARGEHSGAKLSGGEQQMLAIARVLRAGPTLLLLDEPSEGLAPVVVHQIKKILQGLKAEGMSMLLVEQNLKFALSIADRHTLLVDGEVKETLTTAEVRSRDKELLEHLSV